MSRQKVVYVYNSSGELIDECDSIGACSEKYNIARMRIIKKTNEGKPFKGLYFSLTKRDNKFSQGFNNKIYSLQTDIRNLKEANYNLIKTNKSLYKQLMFFDSLEDVAYKEVSIDHTPSLHNEATVIVGLSDVHVEETVKSKSVSDLNEYNLSIAEKRVTKFFNKIIKLTRQERKDITINTLVLNILGDLISGYIHEELIENNSLSPVEAARFIKSILIPNIKYLSENGGFDKIVIPMVCGNHARTTKKISYSSGYRNSYEYMLYKDIEQTFTTFLIGYNNIEFLIPEAAFAVYSIYGKRIRACHGNHFNYRGGIGGLHIPLMTWLYKKDRVENIDMTIMGHWHTYLIGDNYLVNGSVKGFDAYAYDKGMKYEPPLQQFQLIDAKRGFTVNKKIYLLD